jgi:hypothetical protein
MIKSLRSILEARLKIRTFEIGQFVENVLGRQLCGEQLQHVRDPNAHTANTGSTTALFRVDRNP